MTTDHPNPVLRNAEEVSLTGIMAIYDSQAEASAKIPRQWREFLETHPALRNAKLYGASPCTADRKIHYLTGVAEKASAAALESSVPAARLTLAAGEYAVVQVDDPAQLRDTWIWLLRTWLPASGRREKNTPEFERYTAIAETGAPLGPVEIWIPLEPLAGQ
jgi:AraC family transcriptional regulator